MNFSPPKKSTFIAACVLAALGLVVYFVHSFLLNDIARLGGVGFVLLMLGFILLGLGVMFEKL